MLRYLLLCTMNSWKGHESFVGVLDVRVLVLVFAHDEQLEMSRKCCASLYSDVARIMWFLKPNQV